MVVTTPPAASVPWNASANSGQLGANRASTSPGAKPRAASPAATRSAPAEGEPAGAGRLEDVDVESRAGVQRAAQVHLCAGARRWHKWERQRKVERVPRGERCELLSERP